MTNKQQVTKNIDLSRDLMSYMISHRQKIKPDYSYVVFSETDNKLNKLNERLLQELVEEGRRVIKALKLKGNKWVFTVVN